MLESPTLKERLQSASGGKVCKFSAGVITRAIAKLRSGRLALVAAFIISIADASPLDPGHVEVLDGDTI